MIADHFTEHMKKKLESDRLIFIFRTIWKNMNYYSDTITF